MEDSKKVSFGWAAREYILPRKKILFFGLLMIVVKTGAGLYVPYASKLLIDDVIPGGDLNELYILLGLVAGAIFIQALMSYLLTWLLSVEAQRLIAKLRTQVQKKVLRMPISFFDNTKAGTLVARIMEDVSGVRNLVGTGFVQMIGGVITAIVSVIILVNINALMTVFTLIPVAIFGIIALKAFGKIRPIFRTRGQINAEVTGRLTETLSGVRVIKGFGAEKREDEIFENGVMRLFDNVKSSLTAMAFVTSSATFLLGMASVLIMGLGAHFIMEGEMTTGELFSFILYLGFMIQPIVQMSNIGSQLTEAMAGLDRTQELMSMPEEDEDEVRVTELQGIEGDIEFKDVSFSYDGETEVIHSLSFKAPKGSVTALVGSSGSGKTTIASLAASFLNPTSGQVILDGIDMRTVHLSSFRKHLGVVLQDDFLFEGSIRDNILFPRPNATEEELQAAVKAAYVNEFTDRFENGLETIIGERGVKLSGGQRQRLAIARALLANPKVIILDEATSNLDTESESFIQKSLETLMKDRTTFVIAHRLSTIKKADQILVIEEGKIAEQGTHDQLIAKEGRYYQLYTYQSRI